MLPRLPFVVLMTLVACRDHTSTERVRDSPLETGIARELTARFGLPVTVRCEVLVPAGAACEASIIDGTKLPIVVKSEGKEWAWQVPGVVVDTASIVSYIDRTLADLRVPQHARCGARIQLVNPGDRIGCKLSAGGMAFARVDNAGAISLELDLDPTSAAARGELVTPAREQQLLKMSRDLEAREGESDGEEAVPSDGGVPSP